MKRCPNPDCKSEFLFGSDRTLCPFCHSALVDSEVNAFLPPDRVRLASALDRRAEAFLRRGFGGVECHGRVVEIDHHELFNSKRYKLFNALFRGEPYQFAHQTIEYTIRVEQLSDEPSPPVADFCLYGSYMGMMQVGDEVRVRARERNGRRVVHSIYNVTTATALRPGLQIPAIFLRLALLGALALAATLLLSLASALRSGRLVAGVEGALFPILNAVMPIAIMLFGFWMLFRSIFPKRR